MGPDSCSADDPFPNPPPQPAPTPAAVETEEWLGAPGPPAGAGTTVTAPGEELRLGGSETGLA